MHRIALISFNQFQYSETFIHNLVKFLPFEVHYLYEGELPAYYGNHQKFLNEDGFKKVLVAFKAWLGTPRIQQHQNAVEKYLLENRIEAVHANYAITAFPLMDICKRNHIPLIVHFRGWTAYRSTIIEKYGNQYDELFKIAQAVICVSKDMKQQLISLGCPQAKISIIPSGANTDIFSYSDHSDNPPVFIAVGRLCDTKNPHLTILAFSKVVEQVPEAKLVIVGGDENQKCACVNLSKALRIESKVEFKGVLSQNELYEEMKKAFAFVQHSATTMLNEKEGTPNSVMEACAAGLPVVATRHAGIQDVIVENETGLLCDEFAIDAMADNMLRLLRNKPFAQKIGLAASKRVNEQFTTKQYVSKVAAVIDSCLEETR